MTHRSVRCLSFHATYGCQERGACCTAGWPIPVEGEQADVVEASLRSGQLVAANRTCLPLEPVPDQRAPATFVRMLEAVDGRCVFHRTTGRGRCEIHRTLGHHALPLACRQFPRVTVTDPRGVSVTLSHYCPTALECLDTSDDPLIVEDAAAFPSNGEYVGLDATTLPPLLRPGMFMDWDAWWEWESLGVREIARTESVDDAIAVLRSAVEHARTWSPSEGALVERIQDSFDFGRRHPLHRAHRNAGSILETTLAAIPVELRPPNSSSAASSDAALPVHVRRNFLLAHAFADWTVHLGEGLRSWLASIEASDVLCVDAGLGVARTDLWLRHLASPEKLADAWCVAERADP